MILLFGVALYPTYLNKLKLLQNKAICIVTFHWSTSYKLLYIKFNALTLPKLLKLTTVKCSILTHLICCLKFLIITFYLLSFVFATPE